jgi:hypothetical protein
VGFMELVDPVTATSASIYVSHGESPAPGARPARVTSQTPQESRASHPETQSRVLDARSAVAVFGRGGSSAEAAKYREHRDATPRPRTLAPSGFAVKAQFSPAVIPSGAAGGRAVEESRASRPIRLLRRDDSRFLDSAAPRLRSE